MAGRPRKPTALKALTGTLQPCRTNPNEPKPEKDFPLAPAHLSADELTAWNQVVQIVDGMGVLTMADFFGVEELATAYANLLGLRRRIKEQGDLYEKRDVSGETMKRPNPLVAMEQAQRRDFLALLTKFGLTPADRSRVSAINADKGDDDLSLWIK